MSSLNSKVQVDIDSKKELYTFLKFEVSQAISKHVEEISPVIYENDLNDIDKLFLLLNIVLKKF